MKKVIENYINKHIEHNINQYRKYLIVVNQKIIDRLVREVIRLHAAIEHE